MGPQKHIDLPWPTTDVDPVMLTFVLYMHSCRPYTCMGYTNDGETFRHRVPTDGTGAQHACPELPGKFLRHKSFFVQGRDSTTDFWSLYRDAVV